MSSVVALQEHGRDVAPFRIAGSFWRRLVSLPVPISGIGAIPFLAMQVGMNPRCFLPGRLILRDFVRPIEVSFGIPPESFQ